MLCDITDDIAGNIHEIPSFVGKEQNIKIVDVASEAHWATLLRTSTGALNEVAPLVARLVGSSDSLQNFYGSNFSQSCW